MTTGPDGAPRLSVIVAAYNAAATLEAAVLSVLDQVEVPLECIVVDDGSTDDTPAILAALAARDPRVVPVRLAANGGVSAARNAALDVARGTWLAFLDGDDRLRPGGLARMLREADEGDLLAVVGQRISTDGDRTWYPALYEKDDIRRAGRKSIAANPDLLYYVGPAGKLFHRSCAEGLRFEGRMLGDQPWVVRALVRAGDRIGVVEEVVYEWWRPNPTHYVATITSARTESAALGIEAVGMAGKAFEVASAAFAEAYDPATRARLEGVYAARLVRSDLGPQVRGAVRRNDPLLPGMLDALAGFVDRLPPGAAASSDAVSAELLEPIARHWSAISADARGAFWGLLGAARRADPDVPGHARLAAVGAALRVAAVPVVGRPLAGVVLRTLCAAAEARRRVRGRPAARPAGMHP